MPPYCFACGRSGHWATRVTARVHSAKRPGAGHAGTPKA
ncbi:MAG TPA: hypothetical protein ENJ19_02885 [Gammaproteobacteria bacterium]|nr:hypothetical protein [Gammaproteobacteria bacterium]